MDAAQTARDPAHPQFVVEAPAPDRADRRTFLRRTARTLLAAGAVGGLYVWRWEPTWLRIRSVAVPVAGLPRAIDGFTIAQISDLHSSDAVPMDWLRHCVDEVNALRPDLVALTGDYITRGDQWVEGVAETLADLRAPAGVMAVLGNHDYETDRGGGGHEHFDRRVADHMSEALGRGGVTVLRDRSEELIRDGGRLRILGFDDLWSSGTPLQNRLRGVSFDRPTVVLMHNPDAVHQLRRAGADLVLSGHTHGGQVNLPGYGPPFLPVRDRSLVYGLYEYGRTRLYINPGLGWVVGRVRLNARPEITVFTLRAG
jgi:predicted MPP superfamily phosphohydrolase